ncbi:serine hydrolase [Candidatus Riflebacteria bacterium]
MKNRLCIIFLLYFSLSPLAATESPVLLMAKKISRCISAERKPEGKWFAARFIKAVPIEKIDALFKKFYKEYGRVSKVIEQKRLSDTSASYHFIFEKQFFVLMKLYLSSDHKQITGLWFDNPMQLNDSFELIIRDLQKLAGSVALSIMDLARADKHLVAINNHKPMEIGSTFKLYVLGVLMTEIQAGKLHWQDVIKLNSALFSYPGGFLHTWPDDAPTTLHTLATLMISISDNTATDLLIHHLGRDKIEKILPEMGNSKPELCTPFLTTFELFFMELEKEKIWLKNYIKAEKADRYKMLKDFYKQPRPDITNYDSKRRPWTKSVGWIVSTDDLCKAIQWILKTSNFKKNSTAMQILAVNSGVMFNKQNWKYVGYKGGSEGGVLNMTFLMQNKHDKWFTLSASWNHPTRDLESGKFITIVNRCFLQLGKQR